MSEKALKMAEERPSTPPQPQSPPRPQPPVPDETIPLSTPPDPGNIPEHIVPDVPTPPPSSD